VRSCLLALALCFAHQAATFYLPTGGTGGGLGGSGSGGGPRLGGVGLGGDGLSGMSPLY
jgi:hypothetical protein